VRERKLRRGDNIKIIHTCGDENKWRLPEFAASLQTKIASLVHADVLIKQNREREKKVSFCIISSAPQVQSH
jgi:hypothetical protein